MLPTAGAYPCQGRRTRRAAVPGQGAAAMRAERDAKELAVGHHDGKRSRSRMYCSRPGGPLDLTRDYAELRALVQEFSDTVSSYAMVCVVLPHNAPPKRPDDPGKLTSAISGRASGRDIKWKHQQTAVAGEAAESACDSARARCKTAGCSRDDGEGDFCGDHASRSRPSRGH